jgi:hypothetical protein
VAEEATIKASVSPALAVAGTDLRRREERRIGRRSEKNAKHVGQAHPSRPGNIISHHRAAGFGGID